MAGIEELSQLSPVEKRRVSILIGSLVADASAQPLHWVYDDQVREKAISGDPERPEFLVPSANPYYRVPCGSQSPYGDEMMVLLESLAVCNGFDANHYCKLYYETFGPGSPYDNIGPTKYKEGTVDISYPITGPWRNRMIKRFCEHFEKALPVVNDDWPDPDFLALVVPIVTMWAGSADLQKYVEQIISLHQPNDQCLAVAAIATRLIELYVLNGEGVSESGHNVHQLLEILRSDSSIDIDQKSFAGLLKEVLNSKDLSVKEASNKFGIR